MGWLAEQGSEDKQDGGITEANFILLASLLSFPFLHQKFDNYVRYYSKIYNTMSEDLGCERRERAPPCLSWRAGEIPVKGALQCSLSWVHTFTILLFDCISESRWSNRDL